MKKKEDEGVKPAVEEDKEETNGTDRRDGTGSMDALDRAIESILDPKKEQKSSMTSIQPNMVVPLSSMEMLDELVIAVLGGMAEDYAKWMAKRTKFLEEYEEKVATIEGKIAEDSRNDPDWETTHEVFLKENASLMVIRDEVVEVDVQVPIGELTKRERKIYLPQRSLWDRIMRRGLELSGSVDVKRSEMRRVPQIVIKWGPEPTAADVEKQMKREEYLQKMLTVVFRNSLYDHRGSVGGAKRMAGVELVKEKIALMGGEEEEREPDEDW